MAFGSLPRRGAWLSSPKNFQKIGILDHGNLSAVTPYSVLSDPAARRCPFRTVAPGGIGAGLFFCRPRERPSPEAYVLCCGWRGYYTVEPTPATRNSHRAAGAGVTVDICAVACDWPQPFSAHEPSVPPPYASSRTLPICLS